MKQVSVALRQEIMYLGWKNYVWCDFRFYKTKKANRAAFYRYFTMLNDSREIAINAEYKFN